MADLTLRNVDGELLLRLRRRAAKNGRSVEQEHLDLLRRELRSDGFVDRLLSMPDVGDDADFARTYS